MKHIILFSGLLMGNFLLATMSIVEADWLACLKKLKSKQELKLVRQQKKIEEAEQKDTAQPASEEDGDDIKK